jgi:hypothetical protein
MGHASAPQRLGASWRAFDWQSAIVTTVLVLKKNSLGTLIA